MSFSWKSFLKSLAPTLGTDTSSTPLRRVGQRRELILEWLEQRYAPAPIIVSNPDDDGPGSLRAAITQANNTAGADTINFAIDGADTTIDLQSELPAIVEQVTIDGYSEPGSKANTKALGEGDDAVLIIELNGANAGNSFGLKIIGGTGTVIQGLIINRFAGGLGGGISSQTNGNTIAGNFIGTDATGKISRGNTNGVVISTANGNTVGGATPAARNIISGNTAQTTSAGIGIRGKSNNVFGNYIGTDITGNVALPNADGGVFIYGGATENHIGGTDPGTGNLISGNYANGIWIAGVNTNGNYVQGNLIGTDRTGLTALPNGAKVSRLEATMDGILITDGAENIVGGDVFSARNIISGNGPQDPMTLVGGYGINIKGSSATGNQILGNYIGVNVDGAAKVGNGVGGVLIDSAPNNFIGKEVVHAYDFVGLPPGNVISGNVNGPGIRITGASATGNSIQGNLIGLNSTGTSGLENISGITIDGGTKNTIGGAKKGMRNIISGNAGFGVYLNGGSTNYVLGNYIGTDMIGTSALGNTWDGIRIRNNANEIIGNVISANGYGTGIPFGNGITLIFANSNIIKSNFIGTDWRGTTITDAAGKKLGNNRNGVYFDSGDSNIIGAQGEGNVIGGHGSYGVNVAGPSNTNNRVQFNFIGTDDKKVSKLPNAKGATLNDVKTTNIVDDNTFVYNLGDAIVLVAATNSLITDNFIYDNGGIGVVVEIGTGNTISHNSIYNNAGLGINLVGGVEISGGVTKNDTAAPADSDNGPSKLQNYPVIQSATVVGSTTVVVWSIDSDPAYSKYPITIEWFDNTVGDPSGYGEGEIYLGSATAPNAGTFSTTLSAAASYVTATATDADGNTSEFSSWLLGGPASLSINDVTGPEGFAGNSPFTFTVTLSNPVSSTVSVNYTTLDGTATVADNDYVAGSGTLTFDPFQTTKTITVNVTGDTKYEPTETFTVRLSNPVNASIADNSGTGTITNDDNLPSISINDVSMFEGNSGLTSFVFTVSLSNPSYQTISVNYATSNGTATAPSDYIATSGTITFNPGETTKTITVSVVGDMTPEMMETFWVNLSGAINASIADAIGAGMILNDDF